MEPKFKVPERPSKLDRFIGKLSHWLKVEAGKSRKQKRTVKQLHAETSGSVGNFVCWRAVNTIRPMPW